MLSNTAADNGLLPTINSSPETEEASLQKGSNIRNPRYRNLREYLQPGRKFGKWELVSGESTGGKHPKVKVKCEHTEKFVNLDSLINGMSKGCHKCNKIAEKDRGWLQARWYSMVDRCHNPKSTAFKDYGERGIEVHMEWREDFEKFKEYVKGLDNFSKDMTLDRIHNDIGYCPGNIRWVPMSEQLRNTRRNTYVEFKGETMVAEDFFRNHTNLSLGYARRRLREGYTPEQIAARDFPGLIKRPNRKRGMGYP